MPQTHTFHISGMHCKACVLLTEEELKDHPDIVSASTNLGKQSVTVSGNFGDKSPEEIAKELTETVLQKHGYALSVEKQKQSVKWNEFQTAIPLAVAFLLFFLFLQKTGLVDFVDTTKVTYGTAFLLGIIASLSSCMAIVGGLVLSISASFAKEGDKVRPQVLFHLGRIVSFFVLGGVIGSAGSMFQIGQVGIFAMGLIVGIVMLFLGINLLDITSHAKRFQITMPRFFSKKILNVKQWNHTLTPALIGVATFFLPCGFTQSMQLYALTTGSFLQGSLVMLSFSLGTFPVLAIISFSSLGVHKRSASGVFFKTAGLIVIAFAILNIIGSVAAMGWINPIIIF